ncbi:MAG: hypothetical protein KF718_01265 [Polyangiaceae bacterium]|nr:hypothetical protein [Polyangiaceae bacterium]
MKTILEPKPGDVLDATDTMYPSRLELVSGQQRRDCPTSTHYGVVLDGTVSLRTEAFDCRCAVGSFFCVAGALELDADGRVAVIERLGFLGLTAVGSIERSGRLAYIDGCSDTLLVAPPRLGDPCLNHLHFPKSVRQSLHRHPSIRLGVVTGGRGIAFGPEGWEQPLARGAVFLLSAHETHAFRTDADVLDVIAYHPDSDWGPTDESHPMLSRTYLTSRPM